MGMLRFNGGGETAANQGQKMKNNNHLQFYNGYVTKHKRNKLNGHPSGLVWFTGLSGSGKSTLAHHVEKELFKQGMHTYVLDGDNIRHGLNADLGFTRDDRKENLRRIMEVSNLFLDAGIIVLTAFISPYEEDRLWVRQRLANDIFLEIYVKCSIEECQKRDPKGNYEKARVGIITNYTGISAHYEEPSAPDLVIDTEQLSLEDSLQQILNLIIKSGLR